MNKNNLQLNLESLHYSHLLIASYLSIGISMIILNIPFPQRYMILLMFFTTKTIFNFRKCTISYLECKIRNVKKEDGYLNSFMDSILNIRYHKNYPYIFTTVIIFIFYDLYCRFYKIKSTTPSPCPSEI
jgi:hypothetical protein